MNESQENIMTHRRPTKKSIGSSSRRVGADQRPRIVSDRPLSLGATVVWLVLIMSMTVQPGWQDEQVTNTSVNISHNSSKESVKIGNTKTSNFNIAESNYAPTQMTQVVVNLPKLKKMRKLRPPTEEEFAIKRRILQVYNEAREPNDQQHGKLMMNHLGSILRALNPKYIATYRVRHVAFADPSDPNNQLDDTDPELDRLIAMDLRASPGPIEAQIDTLSDRFKQKFFWDEHFIGNLLATPDQQLSPTQSVWKQLLICLDDPSRCLTEEHHPEVVFEKPVSESPIEQSHEQPKHVELVEQPEPVNQPEPTRQPEPVNQPEPTRQLEPTRQPEPTRQLEPTRQPKPRRQPKPLRQPPASEQQQPCDINGQCGRPQESMEASDQVQVSAAPPIKYMRPMKHRVYWDSQSEEQQPYQPEQPVYYEEEPVYEQTQLNTEGEVPGNIYGQPQALYEQQPLEQFTYKQPEVRYQLAPVVDGPIPYQQPPVTNQVPLSRAANRYWRTAPGAQYPQRYVGPSSNYLNSIQQPSQLEAPYEQFYQQY